MEKRYSVRQDFTKNWVVISILIFGLMPDLMHGYALYIIVVLFQILFQTKYDNGSIYTLLFSFVYISGYLLQGFYATPSEWIIMSIFPIIIYQSGKYLLRRFNDSSSIFVLLTLLMISMCLPAIYFNLKDYFQSGQLINVLRKVEISENMRSATGYGMMVAISCGLSGIILTPASSKLDKKFKLLILSFSLLSLFCTIHLINRTGLVIALASFITAILMPPYSQKRLWFTILMLLVIAAIIFYYLRQSSILEEGMAGYINRDIDSGTFGGRSERWGTAFNQMFITPFGTSDFHFNGSKSYAHNMWLDAGLRGGILAFAFLGMLGIRALKSIIRILNKSLFNGFERSVIILYGQAIILQALMEPVIEGVPQLFYVFILYTSLISNYKYKLS